MKKHKKLLIRIGSILACVLLVAGLALPCFALDVNSSYYDVVNEYVEGNNLYNRAYSLIMSNKLLQNTTENFNYWLTSFEGVLTGTFDNSADPVTVSIPYYAYNEAPMGQSLIASNCSVAIVIQTVDQVRYSQWWDSVDIVFSLIPDIDSQSLTPVIVIGNKAVGEIYLTFLCQYVRSDESYVYEGVSMPLSAVKPLIAVMGDQSILLSNDDVQMDVFVGYREGYGGQSDSARVLLGDDLADSFSPRSLLTGWVMGINIESGATEVELQEAYDNGFTAGQTEGYNNGFEAAAQRDFGGDILGEAFSKPMEMLRDFTIVSLPNGVDITLGHVASALIAMLLVIAFLKIYAGG